MTGARNLANSTFLLASKFTAAIGQSGSRREEKES